jgi:hypothetical protein
MEVVTDITFWGGAGNCISGFGGSQAGSSGRIHMFGTDCSYDVGRAAL